MEIKELETLLEQKDFKTIRDKLSEVNPVDLASLLAELDEKQLALTFRLIEKERAAETFSYMDTEQQELLLSVFTNKEIKEVLDTMFTDDTVDLLEDMPANVVNRVLSNLDNETRSRINEILRYPEDSAGSIMTIEYVDLRPEMTVETALQKIKRVGIRSETIYTCYVTNKGKLLGAVSAKDLLTSNADTKINDLMETNIIKVGTHEDKENVAKLFRKYDMIAIPVVDCEDCIVGIVTVDDAMDVMTSEVTEDITKMAAINPSQESYFKTSVWKHAKNRVVWLLVLMISATVTGFIITYYENAITTIPLLASFIPMLMDTGGNCGSQSSTLVIRGLAVDEIKFRDIFRVMWKEFRVSILVSSILAIANGVRIYIMYFSSEPHALWIAIAVSLSIICIVVLSNLFGCSLPLLASKIKLDPALLAAPLITTIIDTFAVLIFFEIASHMLPL